MATEPARSGVRGSATELYHDGRTRSPWCRVSEVRWHSAGTASPHGTLTLVMMAVRSDTRLAPRVIR
jgi:hypothetical protein